MTKDDNHPAAQCHHSASDLCHVRGNLMAFCLNQTLRHQKYQQRRFQSTVVLCFERKSPFIIFIQNFLQNGKPHIYYGCKRVSILPKILATKRARNADLPLRGWNSVRSIRYKDSERKWINCGTFTERNFKSNKVFLRSRSLYVLQVIFRAYSRHRPPPPSLVVQRGLEIECEVINSRATMLQSRLTVRYLDLVKDLYTEPAEDRLVGTLLNFVMTLPPMVNTPAPVKRKKKATAINASGNRDIREMFGASKMKKHQKLL